MKVIHLRSNTLRSDYYNGPNPLKFNNAIHCHTLKNRRNPKAEPNDREKNVSKVAVVHSTVNSLFTQELANQVTKPFSLNSALKSETFVLSLLNQTEGFDFESNTLATIHTREF